MAALPVDQWKKGKTELVLTKKNPTVAVELKESRVLHIFPCSDLLGHIYTGDVIDAVNGQKVRTTTDLNAAVQSKVPGKITIEYRRDEHCIYNMKPLPSPRPDIVLFEITLTWRSGGTPIGLLIHRDFSGRVVVAMVESGSTASRVIRPGDFLVKVEQKDVTDRDQARKLIMEAINSSKRVCLTLERQKLELTGAASVMAPPPPSAATGSTEQARNDDYTPTTYGAAPSAAPTPKPEPPKQQPKIDRSRDAPLPADVLEIMAKNRDFYKTAPPNGPALKKMKNKEPAAGRVDLQEREKPEEVSIPADPSPKPLKVTPKRVGS